MWSWLKAAHTVHLFLAVLAAIGFFHFWIQTRFWVPRYVHWLAGFSLAVGLACSTAIPSYAPINQGPWVGLKKAALVLVFPGLVYFYFVFFGGQRVAYDRTREANVVVCSYCRSGSAAPGDRCQSCGQTLPDDGRGA